MVRVSQKKKSFLRGTKSNKVLPSVGNKEQQSEQQSEPQSEQQSVAQCCALRPLTHVNTCDKTHNAGCPRPPKMTRA